MGNPNFWRSRTDFMEMPSWTSLCSTDPMYETLSRNLDFKQINNEKPARGEEHPHHRIGAGQGRRRSRLLAARCAQCL